ncbi:MAG: hypothetical protein AB8H86_06915 [Polyangiales bacterium]
MKAQLRRFARGLRRRLSNLAWGLGGGSALALIVGALVRNMLPLRRLPDLLAAGVTAGICLSILAALAAFAASVLSYWARPVSVSADSEGVRFEEKGRSRGYAYDEVGGVLRHRDRVWVVLRNANVHEFTFDAEEEAEAFEASVRSQIGDGRIELVPHPTATTGPLALATMGGTCGITMSVAGVSAEPQVYVASMVIATAILAAGRLGMALRGENFVLGHDGVRLGKVFVPLGEIASVQVAKERVSITRKDGESVSAKVRMSPQLAAALHSEFAERLKTEAVSDDVLRREEGEEVHVWLERVRSAVRETSFRNPGMQKERVRVAALHPKSPLRVRVAALAGLMDEDPELAEELLAVSADPRLEKAAKAAQGSPEGWRRVVDRLEREGVLE